MREHPDEDGLCKHLMVFETCTMCNGREAAERNAARQIVARWVALYPGTCCVCKGEFDQGDSIARRADGAYVHDTRECT